MAYSITPSADQAVAQLRILIPALGAIATTTGILTAEQVGPIVSNSLIAIGPLMYLAGAIWSLTANTRFSIMVAAAKPVTPDSPVPQIVLPAQEKVLADSLPHNVSTTETNKVVSCTESSQYSL
jgi:hypothetical protein